MSSGSSVEREVEEEKRRIRELNEAIKRMKELINKIKMYRQAYR